MHRLQISVHTQIQTHTHARAHTHTQTHVDRSGTQLLRLHVRRHSML